MNTMKTSAHDQQGAMLLEALIAILIFSMGILAIVGLQAASVRMSGDAKYRTDANMLANRIIAKMWVDDRTPAILKEKYENGVSGVEYTQWASDVQKAMPRANEFPPTINVFEAAGTNSTSALVTVTVFWNLPGEPPANRHAATVIAQIR